MKTYFKDPEKQGRVRDVCQAAPGGVGAVFGNHWQPSSGQSGFHLKGRRQDLWRGGDLVGMRHWEAAISPRCGLCPPLLPQACQPKAPRVSQTTTAAMHLFCCRALTILPTPTAVPPPDLVPTGSASYRGNLRAVVVSAHAHTRTGPGFHPFLAPSELNVSMRRKQDYDNNQVLPTLLHISGLRDMINTNGSEVAHSSI